MRRRRNQNEEKKCRIKRLVVRAGNYITTQNQNEFYRHRRVYDARAKMKPSWPMRSECSEFRTLANPTGAWREMAVDPIKPSTPLNGALH